MINNNITMASNSRRALSTLLKTYGLMTGCYFGYITYNQVVDQRKMVDELNSRTSDEQTLDNSYLSLTTKTLQESWKENGKRSLLFPYYASGLYKIDWKNLGFLKETKE